MEKEYSFEKNPKISANDSIGYFSQGVIFFTSRSICKSKLVKTEKKINFKIEVLQKIYNL